MAKGKKSNSIYDETVDKAVKTGFLFSLSINYYENHTRNELIKKGYNEDQIECANRVLSHFDTTVGAKLGRCQPELWSIQPCADCGEPVDYRKFNTAPIYGAFLCKMCKLARDAPRRCVDCGNRYPDPSSDQFSTHGLVNRNFKLKGNPYICRWCALLRGDMEFIEKRTPQRRDDERILTTQLKLINPRQGIYPTSEELRRERTEIPKVDYISLPRHAKDIEDKILFFKGEDISDKGKGFFIRYTGYVWRMYKEPPPENSIDTPYFLIYHPNDPRKIVLICRVQYFHRDCQGYVETFWEPWPRSMDFKNINPRNIKGEMNKLQRIIPLIFDLEREYRGGRRPGLPEDLEAIRSDYVNLCACHIYLYSDDTRPSDSDLASFYCVNRSSLYRHLKNNFDISFSTIKRECERRIKPINVDELPYRFRSYIEQKSSEQVTDTMIKK